MILRENEGEESEIRTNLAARMDTNENTSL